MFAGSGIDAAVSQTQSLHRTAPHQMGGNNFVHIGFRDVAVPDGFRVDDHGWSMFALVEAAGLIDADASLESRRVHSLLEPCLQL